MNKKITLTIILFLIIYLLSFQPSFADDNSSSSADLKSKIQALQTEIASKAAQLKDEISKKLQNRAYIGAVASINNPKLSIQTVSGVGDILTNQFTVYTSEISGKKQPLTLKSIGTKDDIAALGDADENGLLTAKKIIILDPTDIVLRQAIIGELESKDRKGLTVKTEDGNLHTIEVDRNSNFEIDDKDAMEIDIANGSFVLVVAYTTPDNPNQLIARTVNKISAGKLKLTKATPTKTPKSKTTSPASSSPTDKK